MVKRIKIPRIMSMNRTFDILINSFSLINKGEIANRREISIMYQSFRILLLNLNFFYFILFFYVLGLLLSFYFIFVQMAFLYINLDFVLIK